jgi:NO-binding membrane sensor protein with MHYT domain
MTASSSPAMAVSYDHLQVALSVLIAIAASHAALDVAGRVTATRNGARAAWLAGGAISMGSGIWAMHFVGMLAFRLPVAISYYWPTVLAALMIAILASAAALHIVSRKRMSVPYAVISGSILGGGVVGLHFMGMNAMRMAARYQLNPNLVAASVVFAILFAVGGMWLGNYFRDEPKRTVWRRIGAGLSMGTAISAMHYTAMAAATFTPSTLQFRLAHTVSISNLGTLGISAVILILLGTTMLSCYVDRQFDAKRFQLWVAEGKVELAHITRLTVMGELTASIAHEIKQPLAAIVTNGSYCLRQLAGTSPNLEEVRRAIQEIVDDGNRASSIISRIRTLLMKGSPEKAALDINDVIGQVIYFVRSEIDQNGIVLKLDLAEDLPSVLGDSIQLQQAFMNVVMNSIEVLRSVPEQRRELIIRSAKSRGVLIEVNDSGPGLAPAIAERLFEPFFTTKTRGMGLGLSISRSIIESHRGSLSNMPTSSGALFQFILPPASEVTHG